MIDPDDLRPGSRAHAREVFSKALVQGPKDRNGRPPVYVTKAVARELSRERCFRHHRAQTMVRLGQVSHVLPPSFRVHGSGPIRTVLFDGVLMMACRDFDPDPLRSVIASIQVSPGYEKAFVRVALIAGECSFAVFHKGFAVCDLIAFLSDCRGQTGRPAVFAPLLEWLVESFPQEAAAAARRHADNLIVELLAEIEPLEISAQDGPATASWSESVPVAWSIKDGRACLDRDSLTRHLVGAGFDPALIYFLSRIDGLDRPIVDADLVGDFLDVPAIAAKFERVPVFRAWLVLVRLSGRRVVLDTMEADVSNAIASWLAAGTVL